MMKEREKQKRSGCKFVFLIDDRPAFLFTLGHPNASLAVGSRTPACFKLLQMFPLNAIWSSWRVYIWRTMYNFSGAAFDSDFAKCVLHFAKFISTIGRIFQLQCINAMTLKYFRRNDSSEIVLLSYSLQLCGCIAMQSHQSNLERRRPRVVNEFMHCKIYCPTLGSSLIRIITKLIKHFGIASFEAERQSTAALRLQPVSYRRCSFSARKPRKPLVQLLTVAMLLQH